MELSKRKGCLRSALSISLPDSKRTSCFKGDLHGLVGKAEGRGGKWEIGKNRDTEISPKWERYRESGEPCVAETSVPTLLHRSWSLGEGRTPEHWNSQEAEQGQQGLCAWASLQAGAVGISGWACGPRPDRPPQALLPAWDLEPEDLWITLKIGVDCSGVRSPDSTWLETWVEFKENT